MSGNLLPAVSTSHSGYQLNEARTAVQLLLELREKLPANEPELVGV
jgi:hypothetical protein